MKNAPFGIVGLETSLPLTYTELVEKGVLTLNQMVEKMCLNPAKILGLERWNTSEGTSCGCYYRGHGTGIRH